jgi:cytoskeletal protein CcmA (bactofilin family)
MSNLLKSILKYDPSAPAAAAAAPSADAASQAAASDAQNSVDVRQLIVLGKTLTLKGELSADEDLVLFGRLEGALLHTGCLTVGVGGIVVGNIRARSVHVKGTVDGDVDATESVALDVNAVVTGDISAPSVTVVEGARFNGSVKMPAAKQPKGLGEDADGRQRFDGEYVVSARALDRMLSAR